MANELTLTSFAENIFRARDTVSRELIGFIPSVLINSESDGVSINGTINSLTTAAPTLNTSYTPAMTIPSGDDQTIGNVTMTIGQVANVRVPLRGEDVKKLDNVGQYQGVLDNMFAQAFRRIGNTIEAHVGSVAQLGASRAYGTSGTAPFASDLSDTAQLRKILADNGAPLSDLSLVIDTTAGAKLRTLTQLTKANEAASDATLRRGELLNAHGFAFRESAGVTSFVKGAGTGALVNAGGGLAVGVTTIPFDTLTVNTTGIKAGDVITFAADTLNQYVVLTGTTSASGNITIAAPGLRVAIPNDNAITVTNSFTGNVGFDRSAIELVIRPPAQPMGGDQAADRMTVTDPVSGLVYEVALYKGYGMNMIDITTLYQAKVWKPEHVAILKG